MAALESEERAELTVGSDSAGFGEAVVMHGHLELGMSQFGLVARFVEGQWQLEVLERPGWTVLAIQPLMPVMSSASDD